jgi:hypothetical protein
VEKLNTADQTINTLKNEKAVLLAEQADKYKAWDALMLFINTVLKSIKGVK